MGLTDMEANDIDQALKLLRRNGCQYDATIGNCFSKNGDFIIQIENFKVRIKCKNQKSEI